MAAVTIHEVPDSVLEQLKLKAAQGRKSLPSHLLDLVTRDATTPTLAEMMARLDRESRTELSTPDILAAIEDSRERR